MRRLRYSLTALLLALTFSCGSGGGGKEDTAATPDQRQAVDLTVEETPPLDLPTVEATNTDGMTLEEWEKLYGEPCALADRIGQVAITVTPITSWVSATIYDKPHAQQDLTPKESDGGCVLMMEENFHCEPACEGTRECTKGDVCTEKQAPKSVGTMTVTGLSEEAVIEPDAGKNYSKIDFADPAFETGALIEVIAAGDELEGFALQGAGVDLLEFTNSQWTMTAGEPLTLEWTKSDGPGEVRIKMNVDQHGSTPVWLDCLVEDTGSFTIPASMTEGLINYGVTGAARAEVYRRIVDSADVKGGCVELLVYTSQTGQLKVK